ncbi:LysR family transcriptional regulator [Nocardioides hwasunensis]|uniref:LysR family transcriptional regulator n=1 Tax=Nocardioides hwasunensis TaxID=397258 RepID=UPI002963FDD1|nr:LysR family transcriptional regulator [Nocardioides hwasunensis]
MDTRRLHAFVVLAEERHFGRAAARLHIAQPALSQQLRRLEDEVGVRLVDRTTRRVELTEAGRHLLARARQVVSEVDRTLEDLTALAAGTWGVVRMGFVGTATYDVLPRVARRVRAELPDVRLELHGEMLGPELVDAVRGGALDLAVLRPLAPVPGSVVVDQLRTEPLIAAVPSHHPLAGVASVQVADLAGDALVTYPSRSRSSLHARVLQTYRRAGVDVDLLELIEVRETATLVAFVAAGLGVALVPESVRCLQLEGVTYVGLAGTPETVPLALAHAESPTPAAVAVAAIISRAAGIPAGS